MRWKSTHGWLSMRFLINHPMRESNPHSWPAGHILPVRRIGDWTISRGSKIYCWLVLRSSPYSRCSECSSILTTIFNPRRFACWKTALCCYTRRFFSLWALLARNHKRVCMRITAAWQNWLWRTKTPYPAEQRRNTLPSSCGHNLWLQLEGSSFFSLLFPFLMKSWGDQGGVSFLLRFSLAFVWSRLNTNQLM